MPGRRSGFRAGFGGLCGGVLKGTNSPMGGRLLAVVNLGLSLFLLAGGIVLLARDDPDGGAHGAGWILVAVGSALSLLTLFGVWRRTRSS